MDSTTSATDLRLELQRAGFAPIPVCGKEPIIEAWQTKAQATAAEIEAWSSLGAPSTGVLTKITPALDIDITIKDAAEAVEALARDHFASRGHFAVRIGQAPKRAVLFKTTTPFKKITVNLTAPDGTEQKLECLGDGQQIVVDGIHPDTKRPYEWRGGSPGEFQREDLPNIDEAEANAFMTAAAQLLCNDFGYTAARQMNYNKSQPWDVLFANIIAGRDLHDSLRDLAAKKITAGANGGAVTNELRALMDASPARCEDRRWQNRRKDIPRAVRTAEEKFGVHARRRESGEALFDPWQRFVVPEFPLDVLPTAVEEFVCSQSDVIGCDPGGLAMACLVNISAALDHRIKLKMMRNGHWYARPRLWVLLVGPPSAKKTPIFQTANEELHEIQNSLRKNYEDQLRADPDSKPQPAPRYIIQDTTIESCAEILARNPHGVLLERDELAGWIGQMDKYGGAARGASADRAFWLKAYDGGPYLVDRIKRGEIYVANLSISVSGGMQPSRLAELQGLTSDGLLQRFIPMIIRPSRLPKDIPTDGPFGGYAVLTRKLLQAQPAQPLVLDDEALLCLEDLRQRLHDIEQESDGVAEGFQAFVGKLAGVAGSLALVLHMATSPGPVVPFDIASKVCKLMIEFILPHGLEFYRSTEATTDGDRLQRLASYILTSGKDRFVASDFVSNVAGLRGLSVFDLNRRVSPLVAGGWLSPADPGNIPNRAWAPDPAARVQFAAQIALEEKRKANLAALMGSPRKARQ